MKKLQSILLSCVLAVIVAMSGVIPAHAGGNNQASNTFDSHYAINVYTGACSGGKPTGTRYILQPGQTKSGIKSYLVNAYSDVRRNSGLPVIPLRDPNVCVTLNAYDAWTFSNITSYSNA